MKKSITSITSNQNVHMNKTIKALALTAKIASEYFREQVTQAHILGRSRLRTHLIARQVVMYFLRTHYCQTVKDIGRLMNRDHTTVVHSCQVVRDMLDTSHLNYSDLYTKLVDAMAADEDGVPNAYLMVLPRYADHDKLRADLLRLFNIQTIPHEGTIYDPTETQQVLSDAQRYGAPV